MNARPKPLGLARVALASALGKLIFGQTHRPRATPRRLSSTSPPRAPIPQVHLRDSPLRQRRIARL